MSLGIPVIQVPLINGVLYSFGHTLLRIASLEFTGGFTEINYERTRNREMGYSNNPDPVGKTLGENAYTANAVLYLAWWDALQRKLGPGYGDVPFQLLVGYSADGLTFIQDVIEGATLDSLKADNKRSPSPLMRSVDFNPLKIRFNGIDDLKTPLQAV